MHPQHMDSEGGWIGQGVATGGTRDLVLPLVDPAHVYPEGRGGGKHLGAHPAAVSMSLVYRACVLHQGVLVAEDLLAVGTAIPPPLVHVAVVIPRPRPGGEARVADGAHVSHALVLPPVVNVAGRGVAEGARTRGAREAPGVSDSDVLLQGRRVDEGEAAEAAGVAAVPVMYCPQVYVEI